MLKYNDIMLTFVGKYIHLHYTQNKWFLNILQTKYYMQVTYTILKYIPCG